MEGKTTWRKSNTMRLNAAGTKGLSTPIEVSQMMVLSDIDSGISQELGE